MKLTPFFNHYTVQQEITTHLTTTHLPCLLTLFFLPTHGVEKSMKYEKNAWVWDPYFIFMQFSIWSTFSCRKVGMKIGLFSLS